VKEVLKETDSGRDEEFLAVTLFAWMTKIEEQKLSEVLQMLGLEEV